MDIDWYELFRFGVSPLEIVVRGTLVFWFVFALLRLAGRRDFGSLGAADLLLLVLIADAAQNGMAGDYTSVAEGMVLVATLVFWSVAIDLSCYFLPGTTRWLKPDRVCLVRDGVIQRRGMRREYVTQEELMSELRLKGIEDLAEVRRAYIESSGDISVLRRKAGAGRGAASKG